MFEKLRSSTLEYTFNLVMFMSLCDLKIWFKIKITSQHNGERNVKRNFKNHLKLLTLICLSFP